MSENGLLHIERRRTGPESAGMGEDPAGSFVLKQTRVVPVACTDPGLNGPQRSWLTEPSWIGWRPGSGHLAVHPTSVAVYQLGNIGTARAQLRAWTLCRFEWTWRPS